MANIVYAFLHVLIWSRALEISPVTSLYCLCALFSLLSFPFSRFFPHIFRQCQILTCMSHISDVPTIISMLRISLCLCKFHLLHLRVKGPKGLSLSFSFLYLSLSLSLLIFINILQSNACIH